MMFVFRPPYADPESIRDLVDDFVDSLLAVAVICTRKQAYLDAENESGRGGCMWRERRQIWLD